MSMLDIPIEIPIVAIIGVDDDVGVNEYTATVDLDVRSWRGSLRLTTPGTIVSVKLVASFTGAGAVPAEPGWVFFFDADPNTTAGDATITAAERATIIGQVEFVAADWDADAVAASAYHETEIPFHHVNTLFAVFRNEGAAINNAGGDDEILELHVWYRRDA